jgi:hypothetical protein
MIPFTLWKIDGEAYSDGSGGPETVWVLTVGDTTLPDPQAAICSLTNGRYSFYKIDSVRQVDEGDEDTVDSYCDRKGVVNQTEFQMHQEVTNGIAWMLARIAEKGRWVPLDYIKSKQ